MGRHLQDTGDASVCQKEEAFIIIIALEPTAYSLRFAPASGGR
jgi:hypothetical protein